VSDAASPSTPDTPERQRAMIDRLERALLHAGGTHRLADVIRLLQEGRSQWWELGDGCCVTELRAHPQLRELNVWLVAGDLDDCMALQGAIEQWARQHGVRRIVGIGRDGWERIACAKMGFRRVGVALERWLDGS